jgi:hypothetical protein
MWAHGVVAWQILRGVGGPGYIYSSCSAPQRLQPTSPTDVTFGIAGHSKRWFRMPWPHCSKVHCKWAQNGKYDHMSMRRQHIQRLYSIDLQHCCKDIAPAIYGAHKCSEPPTSVPILLSNNCKQNNSIVKNVSPTVKLFHILHNYWLNKPY